jgi:hypothetical protein
VLLIVAALGIAVAQRRKEQEKADT